MKTLEDAQNAEVIIWSEGTPLTHAKDAACFLMSCAFGTELEQNSSMTLQSHRDIDGRCKFFLLEGFTSKVGFESI